MRQCAMVRAARLVHLACSVLLYVRHAKQASNAASEGGSCPGGCVCRSPWDCQTAPQPVLVPKACCGRGLVCCPMTGVSKRKCEEYSRWAQSLGETQCGLAPRAAPLLVGGDLAVSGEVPHMALLGYGDLVAGQREDWLCGGAVVSERWVLTAAHCLHGHKGAARRVRVGPWRSGEADGEGAQQVDVGELVAHPRYRPPARYHDVGLLRVAGEGLVLGPTVRPACLHADFAIPSDRAQACGYGRSEFDADDAGEVLRTAWLSLVSRVECARHYVEELGTATLPRGLPRSILCAGDLAGGKDTCQGDSGGPLHIPGREPCSTVLVGITSFGKFCGFADSAGVYMRVSHYVPWIESVAWPEEVRGAENSSPDQSTKDATFTII